MLTFCLKITRIVVIEYYNSLNIRKLYVFLNYIPLKIKSVKNNLVKELKQQQKYADKIYQLFFEIARNIYS